MGLEFKPKYEKVVELLLYLAHKKPNADQYQAVKFLYLADKAHFNRYGRPITFEVYYALKYGPVASNALDMLEGDQFALKKAGIDSLPVKLERAGKYIFMREPLREVNLEVFSKSDLKIFDEVLQKYGNYSFDELYELTHSHFAYENAWKNRDGNRALMNYEDMLDGCPWKTELLENIGPIALHL